MHITLPDDSPLAVVAAHAVDRLPATLTGRQHPQRLLIVAGDSWFSLGPSLVFVLWAGGQPSFGDWPIYALALALALRGRRREFLVMSGLACLTFAGCFAAFAPALVFFTSPPAARARTPGARRPAIC